MSYDEKSKLNVATFLKTAVSLRVGMKLRKYDRAPPDLLLMVSKMQNCQVDTFTEENKNLQLPVLKNISELLSNTSPLPSCTV